MTSALIADALTKRYGRRCALRTALWTFRPARRRPGRAERRRQVHAAATGLSADRPDRGAIEVLGARPAAAPRRVGFVAQDTPVYAGLTVADHLRLGARLNPAGTRARRAAHRPGRPGPDAEGGPALRRPARPAGPDRRRGETARAAASSTSRWPPRPAGPAQVPAGPDGVRRRAGRERRAVLASGRRPGTGLRPPDRAGRLPGADGRRRRRPARRPPPAGRAAARRPPPGRRATLVEPSHTEAQSTLVVRTAAPMSTRPGRSTGSTWRTSCSPT